MGASCSLRETLWWKEKHMGLKLLTAQDANWDLERRAFNLVINQQPAGIAAPQSADEVSDVVRSAAADGKRVAAQRTGHLAAPLSSLTGTVLLHTAGLGLVPQASDLGFGSLHGSAENVGITGYTLGGGISFYARKHGLACNRVTAIELVTAGGEQIRVDAANEPDLFWALRGGGGSFGVVTALEFYLLPLPQIFAGALFFPAEEASDVLHGWREWIGGVPEEMTSLARLLNLPPVPQVPEPFRGRSFTLLELIYCGDPADGEEMVRPLRDLGSVLVDTMAVQPPAGIAELHMDPPEPVPFGADSMLIGELPSVAIESLLEAVGPSSGSQLLSVELRHCGGALSRIEPGSGALATLPGSFSAYGVGFVPVPEAMAPTRAWLGAFKAALAPYDAGMYLNFAEQPFELTKAFPPETVNRLREVKQRYDPDDLFQSNHPVTQ
jgi:FAD/FMN-containing dehydrogenase